MMFIKDRPRAARDFSELNGDPHAVGNLSDAPDPGERQHWAEQYDRSIEAKLAQAGLTPSHPDYYDIHQAAVNGDMTHEVNMEHGHTLPMTKREAILFAPE